MLGEYGDGKEGGRCKFAGAEGGGFDVDQMVIPCGVGCGDWLGGVEMEGLRGGVKDEGLLGERMCRGGGCCGHSASVDSWL